MTVPDLMATPILDAIWEEQLARYREDPVLFAKEILQMELAPWQLLTLRALLEAPEGAPLRVRERR